MGVQGRQLVLIWIAAVPILAQAPPEPEWRRVVERLERLEEQNKQLLLEVRALREELSGKRVTPVTEIREPASEPAAAAPLAERVEVLEQRSAEHEQSKLETEHKMPVQLSGMVLFNAFVNGKNAGGNQMPLVASSTADPSPVSGGTFR